VAEPNQPSPAIALDTASPQPAFDQVRSQLAAHISAGSLPPGARLPTVRQLAADLGLAANTVAKSYRQLEAADLIETRGRAGSFVSAGADQLRRRLHAAAECYAATARDVGASPDEARRTVFAALQAHRPSG
jgi:DNA-binding transcriptional regulator YhcF (GntR family)